MKAPILRAPSRSTRGVTSTSTNALATAASDSPIAASDERPPSDAPTSAGGDDSCDATARTSPAKRVMSYTPSGDQSLSP